MWFDPYFRNEEIPLQQHFIEKKNIALKTEKNTATIFKILKTVSFLFIIRTPLNYWLVLILYISSLAILIFATEILLFLGKQ